MYILLTREASHVFSKEVFKGLHSASHSHITCTHAYSTHRPAATEACLINGLCVHVCSTFITSNSSPSWQQPWGPPPEVTLTQYAPLCVTLVQSFASTSRICLQDLPGRVSVAPMEGVSLGRGSGRVRVRVRGGEGER